MSKGSEKKEIKYSFLVPVYNVEQFINKCIDSILSQYGISDYYEIIVVDDGSTDGSGKICDEYAKRYSNIKVIHKSNEGLLMARGTAVKEASGEYFIFVDSDDYIEDKLLSIVDNYIERFKPDFLCYGHFNEKGRRKVRKNITDKPYELIDKKTFLGIFVSSNEYNNIWSKVVKGEILKDNYDEIYSFKTNIGEDKIQTAYLIKYSEKICLVNECLYHYIIRNTSIVHNKTERDLFNSLEVYRKVGIVVNEIIQSDKNDNDRESLLFKYYCSVMNAMMDHIYKYTRQIKISYSKKVKTLDLIIKDDLFNEYENLISGLQVHNRFRYKLLISKKFSLLIILDRILYVIQKITGTAV